MMSKELKVLDEIEEIRQKATEDPQNYPIDYTIRLISAIAAEYAGYNNRNQWTTALKEHSESKYAVRMNEGRFKL